MNGSSNPLIRSLTERTMSKIVDRRKGVLNDTALYNIIYEEVQECIKITIDSVQARGK